MDREWSDHAAVTVDLKRIVMGSEGKERPFRFEQVWTESERCGEIVDVAWMLVGPSVAQKIAFCAADLKSWSDREFEL